MLQTECLKKTQKHILCSVTFFFIENRAVYERMWGKYSRAGQVTEDDKVHALCVLDT